MTDRELMQQALDALCDIIPANANREEIDRIQHTAIIALRERLAQPEQEPVRDLLISAAAMAVVAERQGKYEGASWVADAVLERAQPEQEPVAHTLNCVCGAVWDVSPDGVEEMVHAPNPTQRKPLKATGMNQWQGLTDEEINSVCYKRDWTAPWTDTNFARAIEAKLKEKNTHDAAAAIRGRG